MSRGEQLLRIGTVVALLVVPIVGTSIAQQNVGNRDVLNALAHLLLSVPATALCALVVGPPIWIASRRTPIAAVAIGFTVLYLPFLGWGLAGLLDVAYDRDPGRQVEVRYIRRVQPQKGPGCDLVTSWSQPGATICLASTPMSPKQRVADAALSLRIHRGWLGLEWVEAIGPR